MAGYSVPASIPAISTVLSLLQGRKIFAMEEGPMAGWLYRNLNEKVDKFIVSKPRRNKLITCEGDKDDRIDSGKLAVRMILLMPIPSESTVSRYCNSSSNGL